MWTVTTLLLLRIMQWITSRGTAPPTVGPLQAAWLGLYQTGTPAINQFSTLANIVEANYDGYSRQLVVWFPTFISGGGPQLLVGQDLFFSPTDALVSNLITGTFLADAFYGGNLLAAAAAPQPGVQLANPSRALKVQPQFALPFTQIYGSPLLVS